MRGELQHIDKYEAQDEDEVSAEKLLSTFRQKGFDTQGEVDPYWGSHFEA